MKITDLTVSDFRLFVTLDGHRFWTHTKYTILELGYATYLRENIEDQKALDWIKQFGESIPADPSAGRCEITSGSGTLITSNPILFALAYNHWWDTTGENEETLKMHTYNDALEIQRNRKILNDFNLGYQGKLPKEIW